MIFMSLKLDYCLSLWRHGMSFWTEAIDTRCLCFQVPTHFVWICTSNMSSFFLTLTIYCISLFHDTFSWCRLWCWRALHYFVIYKPLSQISKWFSWLCNFINLLKFSWNQGVQLTIDSRQPFHLFSLCSHLIIQELMSAQSLMPMLISSR
jgi:hypothetical protein